MPEQQQDEQNQRPVKDILESARPQHIPSTQSQNLSRRKDVDRRSNEIQDKDMNDQRRKGLVDRRGQSSAGGKEELLTEKEKALELIRSRKEIKVQQYRKKKLLAGCEPVMGLNYDVLAMDDYPENALVAAAKRDRDFWLAFATVFGGVFLVGLVGLLSAFIAGISAGLCVASLLIAFTSLRKFFFDRPPLHELISQRKAIEFKAINHVLFLEGNDGLAWRCRKMYKYNHNLERNMFSGVEKFSRERALKSVLMSRKHIRLYLLFMIEAQKAYKRLQRDYLENHFKHMEQGWDDTASEGEVHKLAEELDLDIEED